MGFTKKTLHCLGCKAKISSGTVRGHCKPREGEVYFSASTSASSTSARLMNLDAVPAAVARCTRTSFCSNSTASIFYKRKKVQADLRGPSSQVEVVCCAPFKCSFLGGAPGPLLESTRDRYDGWVGRRGWSVAYDGRGRSFAVNTGYFPRIRCSVFYIYIFLWRLSFSLCGLTRLLTLCAAE